MSAPFHINSPLLLSSPLSDLVGCPVYLKLDILQPSGSFKIRGIGLHCQRAVAKGATRLVASSSGNAGLAVAYAGRRLGVRVVICVPEPTPEFMRNKIRAEGADIVVQGKVWNDADVKARELSTESGTAYIHPFDHPDLWEGHSSLITELHGSSEFTSAPPDVIVCSVGGGGLMAGMCEGLQKVGWGSTKVLAVETDGASCLATAIKAGHPTPVPGITSIARSLGALTVAKTAFDWAQKGTAMSCVVSDKDVVSAMCQFLDQHRMLAEPACAASLAAIYTKQLAPLKPKSVVVVVCGGSVVSHADLLRWKTQFDIQ